jgi:phosphatidylethanolamine-binding protein (PEBP) family uncharacterized protein
MRTWAWQLLPALLTLAVAASPARADAFTVRFSWAGIPACERISPAFELAGVPAGAKRLRFEVKDLDVPDFRHGGSTIAYEGNKVRQGAIRYIGPCPPDGQRHRYRWTVEALDALGKVLGTANAEATFPP